MMTTLTWLAVPVAAGVHRFASDMGYRYMPVERAVLNGLLVGGLLLLIEFVLLVTAVTITGLG